MPGWFCLLVSFRSLLMMNEMYIHIYSIGICRHRTYIDCEKTIFSRLTSHFSFKSEVPE